MCSAFRYYYHVSKVGVFILQNINKLIIMIMLSLRQYFIDLKTQTEFWIWCFGRLEFYFEGLTGCKVCCGSTRRLSLDIRPGKCGSWMWEQCCRLKSDPALIVSWFCRILLIYLFTVELNSSDKLAHKLTTVLMAAVRSMKKMYGVCFHAVRQTAGLKTSRLLQHRAFRVGVSLKKCSIAWFVR